LNPEAVAVDGIVAAAIKLSHESSTLGGSDGSETKPRWAIAQAPNAAEFKPPPHPLPSFSVFPFSTASRAWAPARIVVSRPSLQPWGSASDQAHREAEAS
jgi:hypothetical protein